MATILQAHNITTAINNQPLHEGISFSLRQGEILSIIGPSGCGKTVLMRALLGLHPLEAGTITFAHHENDTPAAYGVLFQAGGLFSSLSVADNILAPLGEQRQLLSPSARTIFVTLLLQRVGLEPAVAPQYPEQLSGGMMKRVALARALALDPPLLFLDEPTAGLDTIAAQQFVSLICQLRQSLKLTLFMITHDMATLRALSHRVGVLRNGKLILGTLKAIKKMEDPWVQQYFKEW